MQSTSKCEVTLLNLMGNDDAVCDAARVSFNKEAANYTKEQNDKLIKYLAEHNHWSPFSHAFLSFRIKAPIYVARQLAKHQVGLSWNEVSRRYVDTEPTYYLPEEWRGRATNAKQGSSDEVVEKLLDSDGTSLGYVHNVVDSVTRHCDWVYNRLIASGVCPEQARSVLPQSMLTEWVWSGSLYAFARVCNLRLDKHSQKETQDVVSNIHNILSDRFPISTRVLVH